MARKLVVTSALAARAANRRTALGVLLIAAALALMALWHVPAAQAAAQAPAATCSNTTTDGLLISSPAASRTGKTDANFDGLTCLRAVSGPFGVCIEWKEGDVYLDAIPMALDGKAFTARSADSPGATATCRVNGVPPKFVLTKGIHVLTTPKDPAFKITLWVDIPKTTTTLGAPAPPATTGCAVTTGVELYGGEVTPSGKAGIDNGSPCVITHAGPFSICLKWAEGGTILETVPIAVDGEPDTVGYVEGGIHTCEAVVGRGAPTFVLTKGIHVLTTPKDPSFRVTMYVDTPVPGATGSSTSGAGSSTADPTNLTGRSRLSANQIAAARSVATGQQSTVVASLQTPRDAAKGGAAHLAQNVLLAGILVLLLVFPSELFNSTFDEHHDRVMARLRRMTGREPRPAAADREPAPPRSRGMQVGLFLLVVAIGAVLAELLDPHAAFDTKSVALFVGVVCATLVGAALAGTVGGGYRRARKHPTDAILKVVPLGLLVAVVCVVISRSVHFQPGYLFGLLGGLSFTVALDKREAGRSRLAACVVTLLVALGAWLVFGPVSSVANHPHPAVWAVVLNAVLAALFIGGIEGLLFGLLPLKFMPGHQLALWSWVAWAAITMAVAVVFVQVLLRPSTGYLGKSSTASVTVTYGLFVVFGILSVAFWGWFRLHPDPPAVAVPAPVEPDFEGADGPQ